MSSDSTILAPKDFEIKCLGEPTHSSPMKGVYFSQDDDTVLYHTRFRDIKPYIEKVQDPPAFEMAGPRERIFFDPEMIVSGTPPIMSGSENIVVVSDKIISATKKIFSNRQPDSGNQRVTNFAREKIFFAMKKILSETEMIF